LHPDTNDCSLREDTAVSPRFRSVALDVDSTLAGIEGIDWLATQRGEGVAQKVAELTDRAMRGEIPLDAVYGERLALIAPARHEIDALASEYAARIAPGAEVAIRSFRDAGVRVVLVSGGIREGILPLAASLGIDEADVHAVSLRFTEDASYAGYDESSPLATQDGKREVVAHCSLPRPLLAVGDGSTDVAMKSEADAFAAFTGFTSRPLVVAAADHVLRSFAELEALVMS
jgi:phosphoserine phosphatase